MIQTLEHANRMYTLDHIGKEVHLRTFTLALNREFCQKLVMSSFSEIVAGDVMVTIIISCLPFLSMCCISCMFLKFRLSGLGL